MWEEHGGVGCRRNYIEVGQIWKKWKIERRNDRQKGELEGTHEKWEVGGICGR